MLDVYKRQERTTAQGNAFSKDNEFQREFEDSFDFNETDDQLSSIRAIKHDMESPTPMDRLLCGCLLYTSPGLPVTPEMENGASDSIYFAQAGIPSYGYSAIALERDDVRAHGRDERLPIDSFWKSLDFFYAFTKAVGSE